MAPPMGRFFLSLLDGRQGGEGSEGRAHGLGAGAGSPGRVEALRRIQRLPPRSFLGSLCFAKDASLLPRPTKFRSASLRGICKEERTHCIGGPRSAFHLVPLNTEPLTQGLAEGA